MRSAMSSGIVGGSQTGDAIDAVSARAEGLGQDDRYIKIHAFQCGKKSGFTDRMRQGDENARRCNEIEIGLLWACLHSSVHTEQPAAVKSSPTALASCGILRGRKRSHPIGAQLHGIGLRGMETAASIITTSPARCSKVRMRSANSRATTIRVAGRERDEYSSRPGVACAACCTS